MVEAGRILQSVLCWSLSYGKWAANPYALPCHPSKPLKHLMPAPEQQLPVSQ